jgi:hypothetical protein
VNVNSKHSIGFVFNLILPLRQLITKVKIKVPFTCCSKAAGTIIRVVLHSSSVLAGFLTIVAIIWTVFPTNR